MSESTQTGDNTHHYDNKTSQKNKYNERRSSEKKNKQHSFGFNVDKSTAPNYLFYMNRFPFKPYGDFIDVILQSWSLNPKKLSTHASYIYWLFPLYDSPPDNAKAYALTEKEYDIMSKSGQVKRRIIQSFTMMVRLWGFTLNTETNTVVRDETLYNKAFRWMGGQHMSRVTQALRFLVLFKYEPIVYAFLKALVHEYLDGDPRARQLRSMLIDVWLPLLSHHDEYNDGCSELSNDIKQCDHAITVKRVEKKKGTSLSSSSSSSSSSSPASSTPASSTSAATAANTTTTTDGTTPSTKKLSKKRQLEAQKAKLAQSSAKYLSTSKALTSSGGVVKPLVVKETLILKGNKKNSKDTATATDSKSNKPIASIAKASTVSDTMSNKEKVTSATTKDKKSTKNTKNADPTPETGKNVAKETVKNTAKETGKNAVARDVTKDTAEDTTKTSKPTKKSKPVPDPASSSSSSSTSEVPLKQSKRKASSSALEDQTNTDKSSVNTVKKLKKNSTQ